MLTKEDQLIRRTGITASEAAVLVSGMNTFGRSEHDLYLAKTTDVVTVMTEPMEMGHELEPVILRRLAKKKNFALAWPCRSTRHPEHPLVIATPDARVLVDGSGTPGSIQDVASLDGTAFSDELAEAKAVGFGGFATWNADEDNVPESVYLQCTMQNFVLRTKRVHVGALMGTQVKTYVVEYDDGARELAEAVCERVEQWWRDHIVAGKPPRLDDSEGAARMIRELVGRRSNGVMLQASPEANEAARLYFEAKRDLDAAESKKREAQSNLIAMIGDADGIVGDGFRATNKVRAAYDVNAYRVEAKRRFDMR